MAALSAGKIAIVARREYATRIRSKGFWISTVALPVLIGAWLVVPSLLLSKARATQKLAIVDTTGTYAGQLAETLEAAAGEVDEQIRFEVELVEPGPDPEALRRTLDERVLDESIQAWLWIDAARLADNQVEYHAASVTNFLTQKSLERTLSSVVRRIRLEEQGLDAKVISGLLRSVDLETVRVTEEGSREEGGLGGFALAIFLFMILYTTTLIYGNQVMLGVLEEKSSRVVEIMLSTVRPLELMLGKLAGIGLIGLTQLAIWIAVLVLLTVPAMAGALAFLSAGVAIPSVTVGIVLNFLGLFLVGYFLYATFYAMVGSAFNNPKEAQQLASLAVVFVVLPWMFFMPVLNDPDSTLALVTSLIPVFTPTIMMLRIAVKTPPVWQIALGYVLSVALCFFMAWACARVYRVGILMYGKKPTIKELARWVRHA